CGVTSSAYNTASSGCTSGSTTATTSSAQVCNSSSDCSTITGNPSTTAYGNFFKYTTNANLGASASSLVGATIHRRVASDTSTWTVSSGSVQTTSVSNDSSWVVSSGSIINATAGANKNIQLTLSRGKFTGTGGAIKQITTSTSLTMANVCTYKVGGSTINC